MLRGWRIPWLGIGSRFRAAVGTGIALHRGYACWYVLTLPGRNGFGGRRYSVVMLSPASCQ